MRCSAHFVLLTGLLGHVVHCISGLSLKEVLTFEPSLNRDVFDKLFDHFANMAASEPVNRLPSLHWGIRVALQHCLLIQHGNN